MVVCICWKKGGAWKFGRAMGIERATELCRRMRKLTGVAHYTCHISTATASLADWSEPFHLNVQWLKFNRYKSVVNRAVYRLKKLFPEYEYGDFKSLVEFELFRLVEIVDESRSEAEVFQFLETSIVLNCTPMFKQRSVDIYNKLQECVMEDGTVVCAYTPEKEIIREQEENLRVRAAYSAKKRMTGIERKVFTKLDRGLAERTISNQLRISIQRVNKLKHRACSVIQKFYEEIANAYR